MLQANQPCSMEKLLASQSAYWLENSLESLHTEIKEWLDEFQFLQDETFVLSELLDKHVSRTVKVEQKNAFEQVNQRVLLLQTVTLPEVIASLTAHEKYFAELQTNLKSNEDQSWREVHQSVKSKWKGFFQDYRSLKMDIFALANES
jgi:hypothetical protein